MAVLGFDARLAPAVASTNRLEAAAYSLWPQDPFGFSVDTAVWPSLFVSEADPRDGEVIPLSDGEAPYWEAFGLWNSLAEMIGHLLPTRSGGKLVGLGLDRADVRTLPARSATAAMMDSLPAAEDLAVPAQFVGYDIADAWMISLVLNANFGVRAPHLVRLAGERTAQGLIRDHEKAMAVRDEIQKFERSHAPLFIYSVFELGDAPLIGSGR